MLAAAMLLTGCVAGVLAGLFGIGGGIVIVPVLEGVLAFNGVDAGIRMHIAVATSLATIIPTSISSARAHHKRGAVDIDIVKRWAIFVLAGSLLGTWIAAQLHSDMLAVIFAVLACSVALKMIFFPSTRNLTQDIPRGPLVYVIPAFIGCSSSMMGIGGGTFSVMTLTIFNQPIHRAVGTASLVGLAISLPGTIGFMVAGYGDARLPPGSLGYVNLIGLALIAPATILTAPLGAKIAHGFSPRVLSVLFGIFLLIAGGRLALAEQPLQADPAISCPDCAAWNQPQEPFLIYGNTYYVGVKGLSSILIDAGPELILLDGALPQSAQLIVANIRELGFDPTAVGTITLSHAHFDHAGGIAALQRMTGARVLSSEAGARALRAGELQHKDPLYLPADSNHTFPAVHDVDEVADGSTLAIGDVQLRAIHTPGHTPGGMTWSWQSCEDERCLEIVYADSLSAVAASGYSFADGLGDVLRDSAKKIAALDCDVFLTTHPFFFAMQAKVEQGRAAFVDDQGCIDYASSALTSLERRLAEESG